MLAKVLGSKVYKGENGKEIGFYDIKKVSDNKILEGFPEFLKLFIGMEIPLISLRMHS
jgi:hypothetical protein